MGQNEKKTIMIFAEPKRYFFSRLDNVYEPFGYPTGTPQYYIYRFRNLLGLGDFSYFWGDWKDEIRDAGLVVIFDFGYERGMEKYIKKINPDCRVVLFLWNHVDRAHNWYRYFTIPDEIYSTDRGDCEKYGFKYKNMFYLKSLVGQYATGQKDGACFLGVPKGREERLRELKNILSEQGCDCDMRLVSKRSPKSGYADLYYDKRMDYDEYLSWIRDYGILIELTQKGQRAMTLRTMEALFFQKKLITDNRYIEDEPFYNKNNIFIVPEDMRKIDTDALSDFLNADFIGYSDDILMQYDISSWLEF